MLLIIIRISYLIKINKVVLIFQENNKLIELLFNLEDN